MGDSLPTSYLVQQERNPVTASYLHDPGVQVIEVFSWNQLPRFFWALNPRSPRATPRVEGCQSWRDSTLSSASNAISATGGAPIARSPAATLERPRSGYPRHPSGVSALQPSRSYTSFSYS
jgi:hypothetical protein